MGQLHPHLVLFNHLAFAHDVVFLEPIPHLRTYFVSPAASPPAFTKPLSSPVPVAT
jgi:hypothetical protein